MLPHRLAARALLAGVLALGAAPGLAQAEPKETTGAPRGQAALPPQSPPPVAAAARAQRAVARGAVVVAVGEGATPAARVLARSVYRDPALRPTLDDASARVLVGEAPTADAPASVRELVEVRASVERAGSDVIARRLLASLGAQAEAELVVAVRLDGGRPVARVLRVATATYAPIELGATILGSTQPAAAPAPAPAPAPAETRTFEWPGAADALRAQLRPRTPASQPVGPLAPQSVPAKAASGAPPAGGEVWRSPWFWGAIGVVAAAGATVFAFAKAGEGETDTVHLAGRIAP